MLDVYLAATVENLAVPLRATDRPLSWERMAVATLARHDGGEALGLIAPPDLQIESDGFTGSLGTLFKLAREHRIDLANVAIAPICASYWVYVLECRDHDLEPAAVALVALAYLVERKAWGLLPTNVPEPEEAEELAPLEPWVAEFTDAILALSEKADERDALYFRASDPRDQYELPMDFESVDATALALALQRLLERAAPDPPGHTQKPSRSLSDVILVVMGELTPSFRELGEMLPDGYTRTDCVWWFLALLELMRLGQARAKVEDGLAMFCRAGKE